MSIAILAVVALSLYIRRFTWQSPQEQAITLAIALQGAAAILMLPWTSKHVGQPIYALTGVANLEDLAAHICYVIAGALIVMNSLDIHYEPEELQQRFRQHVELPCVGVISILVFLHLQGRGSKIQADDYFNLTSDPYYWIIVCGILIYALGYAICMYTAVRQEPGFKWLVAGYVISASVGVLACLLKVIVAILPVEDRVATPYLRILVVFFAAGFSLCSGIEWWRYQRAMSRRDGQLAI